MLFRKTKDQRGITLIELLVVMIASSVMILAMFMFTSNSINDFMKLQAEGLAQSKLADGTFRITKVIRGVNFIESATADSITAYSYFAPNDQYTSKISYYLNGPQDKLLADVVPMTADYPIGSLISGQSKTVTIVDGFHKVAGVPTFTYYDSNFTELSSPVTDLQAIKNIKVQLHVNRYKAVEDNYASAKVTVTLRNRKTNL